MQTAPRKKVFDAAEWVGKALNYAQHGRLMAAMAAFGILAGIVYFVYGTPIYQTRSLVYVKGYGSPLKSRAVPETLQSEGLNRTMMWEFNSRRNIVETARRMGLVGQAATWEDVVKIIRSVQAGIVDTSHMEVTVLAKSPEVAREFPKALVETFRLLQEETWAQYRDNALERYSKELTALEAKAEESLKDLSKFEREEKITESTIEQSRLNDLPRDLVITKEILRRMVEVRAKLESLPRESGQPLSIAAVLEELSLLTAFEKEREVKVGDLLRKRTPGPVTTIEAPKVSTEVVVQPGMVEELNSWQELEKERRILEDQIAQSSKQYLPEHRVMKDLNEKLESNERALRAELAVLRQRFELEQEHYESKLVTLEERLPEYHKVNEELGISGQAYSDREKAKVMWDKAREELSSKVAVIAFSEERDWVDMRFKGYTSLRDRIPVSPNKMKLLSVSLLLAVGGALGVPTLVNMMNTTSSTLGQLEDATGLKGIGITPHTEKAILEDVCRSPAIGAKVPNFLLENFRLIRSHIVLNPSGRPGGDKVVMVTSSRPSEGKTSQAANLAWAFQSMGERTLLMDCDLRRGRIHGFTDVSNELGMTHLLKGDCTLDDAIQKSANDRLDVIPRGPVIVGTTDLLCQAIFDRVLDEVRERYDRIVIDTPPVLGLSEASSLQRAVDGVVFVVRAEQTPRKDVADAVTLLNKSGAHVYGLVLNDLDLGKVSNYYNYYYYSSSYYDSLEDEDSARNTVTGDRAVQA
ncbi:MAG: polysaccharide biosynthesis tyrosine autokinase [Verrucomicrobiales bacterium]|nr:polysaccharide biosynthesis tyrosine autokinase [Verrucomicrobiales bacterium]